MISLKRFFFFFFNRSNRFLRRIIDKFSNRIRKFLANFLWFVRLKNCLNSENRRIYIRNDYIFLYVKKLWNIFIIQIFPFQFFLNISSISHILFYFFFFFISRRYPKIVISSFRIIHNTEIEIKFTIPYLKYRFTVLFPIHLFFDLYNFSNIKLPFDRNFTWKI